MIYSQVRMCVCRAGIIINNMDLKRWTMFQSLDPIFAADVKRAYLIGIDSFRERPDDDLNKSQWRGGLMVMKNGDVYCIALTSSDLELLSLEETKDLLPLVPIKIDGLCGLEIQAVSSAYASVTVLTKDGRTLKPPFLFSDNLEAKKVIQIASGQSHTLAVTQEGELYSWGENKYGQLGIGSEIDEEDPVKISGLNGFDKKIVQVACGGWTSFALDTEGNVWSWGDHDDLCLGYASPALQLVPKKVQLPLTNIQKQQEAPMCWLWKLCREVLEIVDFTYGGFRTFLMYLYTERIEPTLRNAEDAIELFKLADYYGEEDLKWRCEQQLKLLTTEQNVCELYSVAILYSAKVLHELAMNIIIPNLNAVVKSDGYKKMLDSLKLRLVQELADEEVFVGLNRKPKE